MKLSTAILHAPWCVARAMNVRALLGVMSSAMVVSDMKREGVWPTARRAWLAGLTPETTSHHMVIQDDAVTCDRFEERALEMIRARPFVPVAFCSAGANVALVLPVEVIPEWIAWCDARPTLPAHDDVRLNKWLRTQGIRISFALPSLVQHGGFTSTMNHHHAPSSATFEQSPTAIGWAP